MASSIFKICTACGKKWVNQALFLVDPAIRLIGYQVSYEAALEAGYLLFNHSCGTTIAVPVCQFQDLPQKSVYTAGVAEEAISPAYCLTEDGEQDCQDGCDCNHVKKIMNIIKVWPKKKGNKV